MSNCRIGKMFFLIIFTLISICTLINTNVKAQNIPYPKQYICYRSSNPITVDGDLNESAWKQAEWTDLFIDIEGADKTAPTYRTRVKMLWTDSFLYIAAWMEEPHIWATFKERESIIYFDNDFEVFLDPDSDNHLYYEFEINAHGTEWDLFLPRPYRDSVSPIFGWNFNGMKSAVKLYGTLNDPSDIDSAWTVEIALPWEVMKECARGRRKPKDGELWRMNFSRVEWDTDTLNGEYRKLKNPEHNWVWSPQYAINMHMPERWGYLQFSENIAGEAKDSIIKDESWEIRQALMQVYYAQKKHFWKNGTYLSSAQELGVEDICNKYGIIIETTSKQFLVSAKYLNKLWLVNQHSKIWYEKIN